MNTAHMAPRAPSLPYEVLRRDDGAVAIAINAGAMGFEPAFWELARQLNVSEGISNRVDLRLLGPAGDCCQLCDMPADVCSAITATRTVRLYEFAVTGLLSRRDVPHLSGEPSDSAPHPARL